REEKRRGPKRPLVPRPPGRSRSLLSLSGPRRHAPKGEAGSLYAGGSAVSTHASGFGGQSPEGVRPVLRTLQTGSRLRPRNRAGPPPETCRHPALCYGRMLVLRADPWSADHGMGYQAVADESDLPRSDPFVETTDWTSAVTRRAGHLGAVWVVDGARRAELRVVADRDGLRVPGLRGRYAGGP